MPCSPSGSTLQTQGKDRRKGRSRRPAPIRPPDGGPTVHRRAVPYEAITLADASGGPPRSSETSSPSISTGSPKLRRVSRGRSEGKDATALNRAAPSLKSSSGNLGAKVLAAICGELERMGRSGTTEGAAARLASPRQGIRRVRETLTGFLSKA
jgi:hypothetical protein